jgi:hypothetical protein
MLLVLLPIPTRFFSATTFFLRDPSSLHVTGVSALTLLDGLHFFTLSPLGDPHGFPSWSVQRSENQRFKDLPAFVLRTAIFIILKHQLIKQPVPQVL